MNKHILIISYYFYPMNTVAAIRLSKIAKFFAKKGWKVTVLTTSNFKLFGIDPTYDNTIYKKINIVRSFEINVSNLGKYYKKAKKNFNSKDKSTNISDFKNDTFKKKIYKYLGPGKFIWYISASFKLRYLLSSYDFDLIYSSYGPISSHKLALSAKKRSNSIWFADFRDHYVENRFEGDTNKRKKVEAEIVKKADKIITVSNGIKNNMVSRYTNFKTKFELVTNGYDSKDKRFYQEKNEGNNKFIISYVGSLYNNQRSPEILFKAISKLISQDLIDKNKFEIKYAGNEGFIFERLAKKHNLGEVISNFGLVNRKKALEIQSNSNLLLIITWNNGQNKGVITGKIYEYMLAERPVLLIVRGKGTGHELRKMISELNIGYSVKESSNGSEKKLRDYILDSYNKFLDDKSIFNPNRKKIEKYDYNNLTDDIINLYESVK
jgi:glycosyltransferase involved in cell wall biosynthesis